MTGIIILGPLLPIETLTWAKKLILRGARHSRFRKMAVSRVLGRVSKFRKWVRGQRTFPEDNPMKNQGARRGAAMVWVILT